MFEGIGSGNQKGSYLGGWLMKQMMLLEFFLQVRRELFLEVNRRALNEMKFIECNVVLALGDDRNSFFFYDFFILKTVMYSNLLVVKIYLLY
jgi:hypothetical protein